jgi:[ribosomal protein S5]-alanine N-acetyltransferase
MPADVEIRTKRLLLRAAEEALLRADLEGAPALARALGVELPDDWPPDLYDEDAARWTLQSLERDPANHGWLGYYFLRTQPDGRRMLIGVGGFKGRPDDDGAVEIGYSIVRSERRHGFGTEAARGLLERAFADPAVRIARAQTMPDLVASIGVIEKIGMRLVGAGSKPGVIVFEITRAEYEGADDRIPH